MKITVLIENNTSREDCLYEHGLSLYIETEKHKILSDTGATDAFLYNSNQLGVDIENIDSVFLSHGHYDHAGGILAFSEINSWAPVYMQQKVGADYYHQEKYIGIDKKILELSQVKLINGDIDIDEELSIFTGITGRKYYPQSNLILSEKIDGNMKQDEFAHEQCIVIKEKRGNVLVSGCAHNGILNILERYNEIYNSLPIAVISGFHMKKATDYTEDEISVICDTARELVRYPIVYYTCHCTGDAAIDLMKPIMGDKLVRIQGGEQFEIL